MSYTFRKMTFLEKHFSPTIFDDMGYDNENIVKYIDRDLTLLNRSGSTFLLELFLQPGVSVQRFLRTLKILIPYLREKHPGVLPLLLHHKNDAGDSAVWRLVNESYALEVIQSLLDDLNLRHCSPNGSRYLFELALPWDLRGNEQCRRVFFDLDEEVQKEVFFGAKSFLVKAAGLKVFPIEPVKAYVKFLVKVSVKNFSKELRKQIEGIAVWCIKNQCNEVLNLLKPLVPVDQILRNTSVFNEDGSKGRYGQLITQQQFKQLQRLFAVMLIQGLSDINLNDIFENLRAYRFWIARMQQEPVYQIFGGTFDKRALFGESMVEEAENTWLHTVIQGSYAAYAECLDALELEYKRDDKLFYGHPVGYKRVSFHCGETLNITAISAPVFLDSERDISRAKERYFIQKSFYVPESVSLFTSIQTELNDIFSEDKIDKDKLVFRLGYVHWFLAHFGVAKRGSAWCYETLLMAVAMKHNYLLTWAPGVMPDCEALVTGNPVEFAKVYGDFSSCEPFVFAPSSADIDRGDSGAGARAGAGAGSAPADCSA